MMKATRWSLSALLAMLLAACQASVFSDLVTRPGGMLFKDDFSDPSSGWTRAVSQSGIMDYDHGAYRMLVLASHYDLWSVPGYAFRDVRLEVDAGRLDGPVQNRFGLLCRFQSTRNFYFFIISSDGYYAIGRVRNGDRGLLGQEMMAYSADILPANGTNHLRFDCVGQTLTAYVNGQVVAATQDADLAEGEVGLLAGAFDLPGVDVVFNHFVVIKP